MSVTRSPSRLLAFCCVCSLLLDDQRPTTHSHGVVSTPATGVVEHRATEQKVGTARRDRIAFISDRAGERDQSAFGRGGSHVWMMDSDGSRQRKITAAPAVYLSPSWSPDGRTIAVSLRRNERFAIYHLSTDWAREAQLFDIGAGTGQDVSPAWSPDGSRLAFSSSRNGNADVYVVSSDGTRLRRLTDDPQIDGSPAWSPSGEQIAFTSNRSGRSQIYTMNADGSDVQQRTRELHCDDPAWSVLNELAYSTRVGSGTVIKAIEIRSGSTRLLSDTIGDNRSPTFAPDGKTVAFVSNRTGRDQIFTVSRNGSPLRQLTTAGRNHYPTWSR